MYEPGQPPGFTIEHLFDEEFVLVTSAPGRRRHQSDYVFVDWGPDFQADHAAAFPELNNTGVNLDLGSMGIDYLLANEASGYFPRRLVKNHVTPPAPAHPGPVALVHVARLHGLPRGARRGGLRADPAGPAAGFEAAALACHSGRGRSPESRNPGQAHAALDPGYFAVAKFRDDNL